MAHGFTDAWASAAPLAPPMWSLCTSCGGWAALQLWQRFEFSRHAAHLREAWPVLRGAALFFADALTRDESGDEGGDQGDHGDRNGAPLRWGPSHSPENSYLTSNGSTTRFLSYDVALDLGVIAQTFRAVSNGAAALEKLGELELA